MIIFNKIREYKILFFLFIFSSLILSSIIVHPVYSLTFKHESNNNNKLFNHGNFEPSLANESSVKNQINQSINSNVGFIENKGQVKDSNIKFYYQSTNIFVGFMKSELTFFYSLNDESQVYNFNLTFPGSNLISPKSYNPLPSATNIFTGNSSFTNLKSFNQIFYYNIYNNIDLNFYLTKEGLKYDLTSHNGVVSQIRLKFSNNTLLDVNSQYVNIKLGNIIINFEKNLNVYDRDTNNIIPANFVQFDAHTYGFKLVDDQPLPTNIVIDPLLFSKIILTSSMDDFGFNYGTGIKLDGLGNIYVIGQTSSQYWITKNAFNTSQNGNFDVFILKYDKNWNLLFSTYIGGSQLDTAESIAFDSANNVYISGTTSSTNFPFTKEFGNKSLLGPSYIDQIFQPNPNIFFLKISSDNQHLIFSDIIGGEGVEQNSRILIEENDNIILGGFTASNSFPFTNNSSIIYQRPKNENVSNNFISEFSSDGNEILKCLPLQKSDKFFPFTMNMGIAGSLIIAGGITEAIPTSKNAIDSTWNGHLDIILMRINITNFQLLYDTYIGGSEQDQVNAMTIDKNNNIYLTGQTNSNNFPTTPNVFGNTYDKGWDIFVTKLNPYATSIIYSTYIGGSDKDISSAITVDNSGSAFITGQTTSKDFPTTENSMISVKRSGILIFITKLSPDAHTLYYSSYLGGSGADQANAMDIDSQGHIYLTGTTTSSNFPSFFRMNQSSIFPKVFVTEFYDLPTDDKKFGITSGSLIKPNPIYEFLINYFFIIFCLPPLIIYEAIVLKRKYLDK